MNNLGWKHSLMGQLNQPVRARVWAVVLPAFAVYVMLLLAGQRGMPTSQRFSQSVHGLITVQSEIEHWTAGSQKFPLRIEPLMGSLDIQRVPVNWYRRERRASQPMRLVELGSTDFVGNYSYIPVLDKGQVVGYYLLVYGNQLTPGMDVDNDGRRDHVVHVLSSTSVHGNLWGCWPGRESELPPLDEAIAQWRDFRENNDQLWHDSARQLTTLSQPHYQGTAV
ncbi:hypothetical protein KDL29_03290 [bacterium]|nr:hypothetical protein [bacterium]